MTTENVQTDVYTRYNQLTNDINVKMLSAYDSAALLRDALTAAQQHLDTLHAESASLLDKVKQAALDVIDGASTKQLTLLKQRQRDLPLEIATARVAVLRAELALQQHTHAVASDLARFGRITRNAIGDDERLIEQAARFASAAVQNAEITSRTADERARKLEYDIQQELNKVSRSA